MKFDAGENSYFFEELSYNGIGETIAVKEPFNDETWSKSCPVLNPTITCLMCLVSHNFLKKYFSKKFQGNPYIFREIRGSGFLFQIAGKALLIVFELNSTWISFSIKKKSKKMKKSSHHPSVDKVVLIATVVGSLLSLYAVYVEYEASQNDSFEALCDISDEVSCSKVFTSEYGKIFSYLGIIPKDSIFDQPNALFGFVFYLAFLLLYLFLHHNDFGKLLLLSMGVASMILSAYLSYILAEVLKDLCVVCLSTYICNFSLFVCSSILNAPNTSFVTATNSNSKKQKRK